jgi:thiamine kinase-like enzyme
MLARHEDYQRHSFFTSIDEIILQCFNTSDYRLVSLPSSLSPWATTRKLVISEKSYVLRILNNQASIANKKAEILTHALFSNAGVSPPLVYSNVEQGILIMEYIENDLDWLKSMDEEKIRVLADLLRTKIINIEGRETDFNNTNNQIMFGWIDASLAQYTNQFRHHSRALAYFNELNQFLDGYSQEKTLCHYELTSGNLLWDGSRFFMIDWELARVIDPMFDLANVAYGLRLTSEQEASLLAFYSSEHLTDTFQSKYRLYKTFVHLLYSLRLFALCKDNHGALSDIPPEWVESIPKLSLKGALLFSSPTDLFETSICVAKEAFYYLESEQFEQDKEIVMSTQPQLQSSLHPK